MHGLAIYPAGGEREGDPLAELELLGAVAVLFEGDVGSRDEVLKARLAVFGLEGLEDERHLDEVVEVEPDRLLVGLELVPDEHVVVIGVGHGGLEDLVDSRHPLGAGLVLTVLIGEGDEAPINELVKGDAAHAEAA